MGLIDSIGEDRCDRPIAGQLPGMALSPVVSDSPIFGSRRSRQGVKPSGPSTQSLRLEAGVLGISYGKTRYTKLPAAPANRLRRHRNIFDPLDAPAVGNHLIRIGIRPSPSRSLGETITLRLSLLMMPFMLHRQR